jgi:hypothetical protein
MAFSCTTGAHIPVDIVGDAAKYQGQCGTIDLLSSLKQRRGVEVMGVAFNNNMLYLLQVIMQKGRQENTSNTAHKVKGS